MMMTLCCVALEIKSTTERRSSQGNAQIKELRHVRSYLCSVVRAMSKNHGEISRRWAPAVLCVPCMKEKKSLDGDPIEIALGLMVYRLCALRSTVNSRYDFQCTSKSGISTYKAGLR